MDYKKSVEAVRWHAINSDLNGSEARLIMYLITETNHITSKVRVSHAEMAQAVNLSKASVTKSIRSLVDKKAIHVDDPATGRAVAMYRVRTAAELDAYFATEQNNPEAAEWQSLHERFEPLEFSHGAIGDGCEECGEEGLCPVHDFKVKQVEDSLEWREYQLWLADNPKPPAKIKMVKGRVVG